MVRDQFTYCLAVCFSISSWIAINGVFAILPSMIGDLPEGWAIASTLGLAIQIANVGPLAYRICCKHLRGIPTIVYGILTVGALSMLLLAKFWRSTVYVFGVPHSAMLIAGTFSAALCDCTSSVVFWPFIGAFAPSVLAGLALGENLSGVVAAGVSWLGLTPGGSFFSLALVLCVSGGAFHVLNRSVSSNNSAVYETIEEMLPAVEQTSPAIPYALIAWMSFLENAVLPAVMPYATARYSNQDYHIASTLPVGTLLVFSIAFFHPSIYLTLVLSLGASSAAGILVWAGVGATNLTGAAILVAAIVARSLAAYCKAACLFHLKLGTTKATVAQHQLAMAGVFMQVASFVGAVCVFLVIHYTSVFPRSS